MRCRGRAARDAGSVTVELALALPSAVLVLALVLGGVRAATAHALARDAAATGARVAAIEGEEAGTVAALHLAPRATVRVVRDGPWWHAIVTVPVAASLPAVRAEATAYGP